MVALSYCKHISTFAMLLLQSIAVRGQCRGLETLLLAAARAEQTALMTKQTAGVMYDALGVSDSSNKTGCYGARK